MNSRERVITALNHKEPDKIPIDLNGTNCTSLTELAYVNLRRFLNLEEDKNPDISTKVMNTVRVREDLLLLYEIDTRTIFMKEPIEATGEIFDDGSFLDTYGVRWRPALNYYDAIDRPLKEGTIDELKNARWENAEDKNLVVGLKKKTKKLFENTKFCLIVDMHSIGPLEGACMLRGYENFLTDLYINQKYAMALLDRITETAMLKWYMLLNEVGNYVQVVSQGDDVGIQTSTFISPEMYRKFVKPCHKKIFNLIHSKTKAKIFYHSCGSVYDLIPDFIDEGADILNPIQRSASKMDIKILKKEFGKDINFWGGGIDVQKQLPFYPLKKIEEEIKRTIEIMAPGGGYIFFSSHNIQSDVSPDKIDCMFKSVIKYRKY